MAGSESGLSDAPSERGQEAPSSPTQEKTQSPPLDDCVYCIIPTYPGSERFVTIKIPRSEMPQPTLPYEFEFWQQGTGEVPEPNLVVFAGIVYCRVAISQVELATLDAINYKLVRVVLQGPVGEGEEEASGLGPDIIAFERSLYIRGPFDPALVGDDVPRVTTAPVPVETSLYAQLREIHLQLEHQERQLADANNDNPHHPDLLDGPADMAVEPPAAAPAAAPAAGPAAAPIAVPAAAPAAGPVAGVVAGPVAAQPQRVFPPLAEDVVKAPLPYGFDLAPAQRAGVNFIVPTRANPAPPEAGSPGRPWENETSADLFVLLEIGLLTCRRPLVPRDFVAITEALHRSNPDCVKRGWNGVHSYVVRTRFADYKALQLCILGY